MKKRIQLDQHGITLIELLIAFVICGFIVGGIYRVFVAQTKAYTVQEQVVDVQQNIRTAMEILLRDLRMAGYDSDSPTSQINIGAPAIPPITPGDHNVTVNYEYDDTHRYQVIYTTTGGTLTRQLTIFPVGGPSTQYTDKILENVDALNFTYGVEDPTSEGAVKYPYVSAAGVGTGKVIAVHVILTAKPDQTNPDVRKTVSPRTLDSRVTLRNQCLR